MTIPIHHITPRILHDIQGLWEKRTPEAACREVLEKAFPGILKDKKIDPHLLKQRALYHILWAPVIRGEEFLIQRVWLMAMDDCANTGGNISFSFYFDTIDPYKVDRK